MPASYVGDNDNVWSQQYQMHCSLQKPDFKTLKSPPAQMHIATQSSTILSFGPFLPQFISNCWLHLQSHLKKLKKSRLFDWVYLLTYCNLLQFTNCAIAAIHQTMQAICTKFATNTIQLMIKEEGGRGLKNGIDENHDFKTYRFDRINARIWRKRGTSF